MSSEWRCENLALSLPKPPSIADKGISSYVCSFTHLALICVSVCPFNCVVLSVLLYVVPFFFALAGWLTGWLTRWVKRTRSEFVIEKKKGFNVTSPICTFDTTNDR